MKSQAEITDKVCPLRAKYVDEICARLDLAQSSVREGAVRGEKVGQKFHKPNSPSSGVAAPHNSDSNGALGASIKRGEQFMANAGAALAEQRDRATLSTIDVYYGRIHKDK